MSTVPAFPRITITIHPDTSGEVTIQGISHPLGRTGNLTASRRLALSVVTLRAATTLGRPVRVTATDEQGTWPLVVHPSGHHHSPEDPAPLPQPAQPDQAFRMSINGQVSPAGRSVLVGRNPRPGPHESVEVLFAVRDQQRTVSKTHARVEVDGHGVISVSDRNSTNGTSVELDGYRVQVPDGGQMPVPYGAVIVLGDLQRVEILP